MKYLFVIVYTITQWVDIPCPDNNRGCMVYHGTKIESVTVEKITTDTSTLRKIITEYPNAKIDTFLLIKKP